MHFDGSNEGAAVVNVEVPPEGRAIELHREPAKDADDAIVKIVAWWNANEWRGLEIQRRDHCVLCGALVQPRVFTGKRAYWTTRSDGGAICPECSDNQ